MEINFGDIQIPMKLKGGHIILGLVAILFVLMVTFSPTVQSYIPPTPAWFRITSGGLNVTAQNSSGVVNFIAGTNMTITPNYATNSITFSSSSSVSDIGNIWDINCPAGEFFNTFSNSTHPNFGCATPAGGSADYTNIAYTNETNTFILPQNINHTLNLENPNANILNEIAGEINFTGRNDNNDPIQYSRIYTEIADPTAGAEAGIVHFQVQDYDGSLLDFMKWDDLNNAGVIFPSGVVNIEHDNIAVLSFERITTGPLVSQINSFGMTNLNNLVEYSYIQTDIADDTDGQQSGNIRLLTIHNASDAAYGLIIDGFNKKLVIGDMDLQFGIDGKNIEFDTTIGSKIGTSTSQKLAFHGATPTIQQAVTGDRYGNTALADFLTDMDAKGLIDDQTTDSGLPSGSTLDTMQNIGTGEGSVYAGNTTNTNFTFKTLKAGTNISIANNTNDITISATDTGEVNTASNFGTFGTGVFKDKSGVDLRFLKLLSTDPNLSITSNSSNVLFDITGSFLTAALTSLNGDTTAAQVLSTQNANELTITDIGAGLLEFDVGPDIVQIDQANTYTGSNTQALGTNVITFGSDPADGGQIRMPNLGAISWEASPAATDLNMTADASENLVLSSGWNNVDLGSNPMINSIFDVAGTGNRLTSTGIATGDILKSDGTDYKTFAKGSAKQILRVNSGATDIEWATYARENLVAAWYDDKTWTNIGTAYVCPYAIANDNCQSMRIDTNGMTTVTLQVIWTKNGAGTQACEIVDNAGGAQLIQINNIVSGINVNATQTIPAAWQNTILNGKILCKSTTAGDDPVLLQGQVLLKP